MIQEIRAEGFALIDDSGPLANVTRYLDFERSAKGDLCFNSTVDCRDFSRGGRNQSGFALGGFAEPRNLDFGLNRSFLTFAISSIRPSWSSAFVRHTGFLGRNSTGGCMKAVSTLPKSQVRAAIADLRPTKDLGTYRRAVRRILQHIASGDCYQVNFTWSLGFQYFGSPLALYQLLRVQQPVQHGAFRSASRTLHTFPFTRTFSRTAGASAADGSHERHYTVGRWVPRPILPLLTQLGKRPGRNLMIVDLMRNDPGRLAEVGTVKVEELFGIESYPTLLQMVSTISAQIPALPLHTILAVLFPCGSVTGAPKIRAMEIILSSKADHGLYTGVSGICAQAGISRSTLQFVRLNFKKTASVLFELPVES
jgi:chorismate binding enzyme